MRRTVAEEMNPNDESRMVNFMKRRRIMCRSSSKFLSTGEMSVPVIQHLLLWGVEGGVVA